MDEFSGPSAHLAPPPAPLAFVKLAKPRRTVGISRSCRRKQSCRSHKITRTGEQPARDVQMFMPPPPRPSRRCPQLLPQLRFHAAQTLQQLLELLALLVQPRAAGGPV